jgi:hypothetical protein
VFEWVIILFVLIIFYDTTILRSRLLRMLLYVEDLVFYYAIENDQNYVCYIGLLS